MSIKKLVSFRGAKVYWWGNGGKWRGQLQPGTDAGLARATGTSAVYSIMVSFLYISLLGGFLFLFHFLLLFCSIYLSSPGENCTSFCWTY